VTLSPGTMPNISRCRLQITSAVTTTVIGEAKIIGLMALSALLLGVASPTAACVLTGDVHVAVWSALHTSLRSAVKRRH
jgi:hypothetical protein